MRIPSFGATVGTSFVLTLSWLSIRARFSDDPFEFQNGSWTDDEIAMAYAPFVQEAEWANSETDLQIRFERFHTLACAWDLAVKQGVLKPLKPTSFEDDCSNGARGDILRAKSLIVSSLLGHAEASTSNRLNDATDEVLLALRLSESQKYGDTSLICSCGDEERQELEFLQSRTADMSESTRIKVKNEMTALVSYRGMLTEVAQASTIRFYDYQRRVRGAVQPAEIRQNAMIGRRIRAEGKNPTILRAVQGNYIDDQDSATLEYLLKMKLASINEHDCLCNAEKILAKA